ncbi:MAG: IclR family transcriptional regulator [Proteobacteria bacterium]|nr:IclR family transcriptional regulator [Pseudomonadota bacterium]
MTLLDALAAASEPATLKHLASVTELHPSTAHRILAAMTTARFVERQDAGTYRLGIRLLELGNLVKSRINVREVALPFMQELRESIGEAINLGARHDDEIVYIERTSSGQRAAAPDLARQAVSGRRFAAAGSRLRTAHRAARQDTTLADDTGGAREGTGKGPAPRRRLRRRGSGNRPQVRCRADSRRRRPHRRRALGLGAGRPPRSGMGRPGQEGGRGRLARPGLQRPKSKRDTVTAARVKKRAARGQPFFCNPEGSGRTATQCQAARHLAR